MSKNDSGFFRKEETIITGDNKVSYFQGWYFKNQNGREAIAFIPAFHIDQQGMKSASLQVITSGETHRIYYPIEDFSLSKRSLSIRIGDNVFTRKGIRVNIRTDHLTLMGELQYTAFTPPKYDIMGPFCAAPLLQCRHSIYSLSHRTTGSLSYNGVIMDYSGGIGYVEGDRGTEFPEHYFWTQCSFLRKTPNVVMLSTARVQMGRIHFRGCVGVVYYHGKEYRLATYLGAAIRKCSNQAVWIHQGSYDLLVKIIEKRDNTLLAPVKGTMSRNVYESIDAVVRYRFYHSRQLLFDYTGIACVEQG